MDGVTNSAYRQIVRSLNREVFLFSEFTSVDGLVQNEFLRSRMDYNPCEHPFFMQLFGNSPEKFAEASRMVEDRGIWGVDINMGCPSKKIVHSQHGSALMKDTDTACRIIESIRSSCKLEVSVKTRLGWTDHKNLINFAKSLESAGASMLTIHGRTYNQAFKGPAYWEPISFIYEKNLSQSCHAMVGSQASNCMSGANGRSDQFCIPANCKIIKQGSLSFQ